MPGKLFSLPDIYRIRYLKNLTGS